MNYIATIKIQNGENVYYEYWHKEDKSLKSAKTYFEKDVENSQCFVTEYELKYIRKITKSEYNVLKKVGVI